MRTILFCLVLVLFLTQTVYAANRGSDAKSPKEVVILGMTLGKPIGECGLKDCDSWGNVLDRPEGVTCWEKPARFASGFDPSKFIYLKTSLSFAPIGKLYLTPDDTIPPLQRAVEEIQFEFDADHSEDMQQLLPGKFGKPTEVKNDVYENMMGKKLAIQKMYWNIGGNWISLFNRDPGNPASAHFVATCKARVLRESEETKQRRDKDTKRF